jgi:hypothetical protein
MVARNILRCILRKFPLSEPFFLIKGVLYIYISDAYLVAKEMLRLYINLFISGISNMG